MSSVISVLNQKGGVGKTTTTINLSVALAKAGKKVCIIDLDPQANATSGLAVNKATLSSSIYNVLLAELDIKEPIIQTNTSNLWIVPAVTSLAAVEQELVTVADREQVLKRQLESIKNDFDYIFIDCPPSLGLLSLNALVAADRVLIPVQAEFYALEGLGLLMQTIQRVQAGLNPDLSLLGVVMTMVDKRNMLSKQVVDEVEKHFKDLLFKTTIPRNVRLAEAPSFGVSIFEHDKWSKGARAYKALAKEVLAR